jgi:hypothetical protein
MYDGKQQAGLGQHEIGQAYRKLNKRLSRSGL